MQNEAKFKPLNNYFAAIDSNSNSMLLDDREGSEYTVPEVDTATHFQFKNILENAVLRAISHLQSKRSFGHNGTSSYILKIVTSVVSEGLTEIINVSFSIEE